jgi:hypothetical protein
LRLICDHALQRLEVASSPTETHSSFNGTWYECSPHYANFFDLAVTPDYNIRHLQTLLLCIGGREQQAILLDFLTQLRGPLTSLALEGRVLEEALELAQLTPALRRVSQTLRTLRLEIAQLAPFVLQLLSETFPWLHQLDLDVRDYSGLEPRSIHGTMVRWQLCDHSFFDISAGLGRAR